MENILVVNSNSIERGQTVNMLKARGFDVLGVSNGFEAMIKAKKYTFDVVVIDIPSPHGEDVKVANTFRDSETLSKIPIIVATNYNDEEIVNQLRGQHVTAIMPRPMDFVMLSKLVSQINKVSKTDIQKTILLAEDDRTVSDAVSFMLSKSGYNVFCAYDGLDAVEMAKILMPSAIVMDFMMPGATGTSATEQIRAMKYISDTVIIGHTASVNPEIVRKSMKAGCNTLFGKPAEIPTLVAKIEEFLSSK